MALRELEVCLVDVGEGAVLEAEAVSWEGNGEVWGLSGNVGPQMAMVMVTWHLERR